MAKDEQPTEGAENEDQNQQPKSNERPAGAPEGAVGEATTSEVKKMYDDLGIKAPVPSDKPKGRPKAADGGDKKTAKKDDASGKPGEGRKADDGKDKSRTASASDSDGADGNDADASGKKVSSKDGKDGEKDSKVSGDGDKDADSVQKAEPSDNGKTPKSGEGDAKSGDDGTGEEDGKSGAASEEGKEDEGKRPGKSNPEVEKRMQRLAADRKEALERAEKAEKQLQETTRKQAQEKVAQEDPEYTVDDFRKVRDNKTGDIIELDAEKAELAWRRWKDGYDQRATERDARANYEADRVQKAEATTRQMMKDSADAYDALAGLMDEYPELVEKFPDGTVNENFDEDFAADVLPIIQEAIEYLPGTEPGNKNDKLPIIVGLRIDPKKILVAMKGISNKKRNLPLNGVNDNVDSGSGVNVPHSRSSDPTINAANDLYKELGIKKRI